MNKLILICIAGILCISCRAECLIQCGNNNNSCSSMPNANQDKCIDAYVKCCEVCK
jgi:hypothetical protein